MKKVRHGVFETNSSSSHSISIEAMSPGEIASLKDKYPNTSSIVLETGEFGWEVETYIDFWTKLSYCFTHLVSNRFPYDMDADNKTSEINKILEEGRSGEGNLGMLFRVLQNVMGVTEFAVGDTGGYIDHQSSGVASDAFVSDDTLRDFLFNSRSVLRTDNDNH